MAKKKTTRKNSVTAQSHAADLKALEWAALALSNYADEQDGSMRPEWVANYRRTAKRLLAIARRLS
jgi:hypothetical protein